MTRLLDIILYGNLWIALAAVALACQSRAIFEGGNISPVLAVFLAGGTLSIYLLHRLWSSLLGRRNGHPRFELVQRGAVWAWAGVALGLAGAIWAFFQFSFALQWQAMLPALLALGYVAPLIGTRRLRDMGTVKIWLVALCWTWLTGWLPLLEANVAFSTGVAVHLLERFAFIFALTIPFELRDKALETELGVATLGTMLTEAQAKRLAAALLALAAVLATVNGWSGYYSARAALAIVGSLWLSQMVIRRIDATHSPDYMYAGVLDGLMVLQSLLVVLSR